MILVVSICIGINDVWSRLDYWGREPVYPEKYEEILCSLLDETKEKTNAQIILMEPTIHGEDLYSLGNQMLVPYVEKVRKLAVQYDAILIPTHIAFLEYLQNEQAETLTTDGVHMNSLGDMLMAKTWLKVFLNK